MQNVNNKGSYSRVQALEIDGDVAEDFRDNPAPSHEVPQHDDILIDRHALYASLFVMAMASSSFLSLIPYVLMIRVILNLTMRWYFCVITAILQFVEKTIVFLVLRRIQFQSADPHSSSEQGHHQHAQTGRRSCKLPVFTVSDSNSASVRGCSLCRSVLFLFELFIVVIMSICYWRYIPYLCKEFIIALFMEADGIVAKEWDHEGNQFSLVASFSKICGAVYLTGVGFALAALFHARYYENHQDMIIRISTCRTRTCAGISNQRCDAGSRWGRVQRYADFHGATILQVVRKISLGSCILTGFILLLSLSSVWTYLIKHPLPLDNNIGPNCDPLDTTECLLPFPSNFFTSEDPHSETGFKVNIEIDALQSMYRGKGDPKHTSYLNKQDGFSTSGTILFYVDGIKESQGIGYNKTSRIVGPSEIELSITSESVTLLIDLESRTLVPHFAEIDYLDEERPLVIVQAAKSLEHNKRYAVALVDAADLDGNKLKPSEYLIRLLDEDDSRTLPEKERRRGSYYHNTILPHLYNAAPWLGDDSTIQILFDFHTASVDGQLGNTRKIVEGSVNVVTDEHWGGWGDHNVRVLDVINDDMCLENGNDVGKIVHAEIDVPSFLMGSNGREKMLNMDDIRRGYTTNTSPFKIVIVIPCSLTRGTMPLRAVVDYGHGFLYSRKELLDTIFLHKLANREGYIMLASNWRGMCHLDLGLIIRAFVAEPNLLESLQANIMQGYGFKAAIQHFVRTHLLSMDFMNVQLGEEDADNVRFLFYGISQGGILGSAYTSLMSHSGILDGSIVSSSGTPLSLLMSRSTVFKAYQALLLMSLHNNCQVRIFVPFLQMTFDAIDGPMVGLAGKEDRFHDGEFKTLIQAGIGDPVVTTIGTETMARDYNASVFPSNPKEIYGITPMNNETTVCITEIMYTNEFSMLPKNNVGTTTGGNNVHWCARQDVAFQEQLVSFINNNEFLDVCATDGCIREGAWC